MTNYGLTIRYTTQETLKSNYLYASQIGLCATFSLDNVVYENINITLTGNPQYNYGTKINVTADDFPNDNLTSCKVFSTLISAESGSNNLYIKLKANTNTSSGRFYFIGYSIQELGVWDTHLSTMMSGLLATQTTSINNTINTQTTTINNNTTQQINNASDNMINDDQWEEDTPDESGIDSLVQHENLLDSYLADDSDLNALSLDINPNDYTSIWQIFNSIITGNTILYSTFLLILTFGVIKTIFAR